MERPGGLLCHQMPAPNLLGRPPGEQISIMWYSHGQIIQPLWQIDPTQGKKKKQLNNKQAAEKKRHVTQRVGSPELWREGEGHSLTWTVNIQASRRRPEWHHLPPCAWKEEVVQQRVKCVMLHQLVGKVHIPTQTLNKTALQLQHVGRAVYWRKQKGHASRRTL
jgi:hypothetical protein